jgi:hypothetical protein
MACVLKDKVNLRYWRQRKEQRRVTRTVPGCQRESLI